MSVKTLLILDNRVVINSVLANLGLANPKE